MSRRAQSTLAWLLAASIVAVGMLWLALRPASGAATTFEPIGGVIAHRGDGWHIHSQGHSNAHLTSVSCKGAYLLVTHTTGVRVPMWGAPGADETLRRWDITASVSESRSAARVFFDIDGRRVSCWHRAFREPTGNVWLHGDIEVPA